MNSHPEHFLECISINGGNVIATCNCGWKTQPKASEVLARVDLDAHIAASVSP